MTEENASVSVPGKRASCWAEPAGSEVEAESGRINLTTDVILTLLTQLRILEDFNKVCHELYLGKGTTGLE